MDINEVMKGIAQYKRLEEEAKRVREEFEAELKAYMAETGQDTIIGDEHKATYKVVTQQRFDSKAFQADHKDMYDAYKKPSTSTRFTFA